MLSRSVFLKRAVRIFFILVIILGACRFHRSGLFEALIHWIEGLGPATPVMYLLIYTAAAVFFIPSFLLTFAGGFLFDFWTAAGLSILGTGLGAVSALLIGRTLARAQVENWASRLPQFGKIRTLAEKKGWKIVLLARLSPVFPFLIGNFVFGTTRIPVTHYFFASLLGTVPSALVYTYSGRLAGSLAGAGSGARTPGEWGLLGLGLAASLAVFFYLRRLAREELGKGPG